jgi:type I restriction enzyme S subunit
MTFMSEAFIKKATNSSTGSVFKGIRINDLLSTMTLLPPIDLLLAFDKKVNELFAMKANCAAENTNLVSLRDFLLPLLMNGQVVINSDK